MSMNVEQFKEAVEMLTEKGKLLVEEMVRQYQFKAALSAIYGGVVSAACLAVGALFIWKALRGDMRNDNELVAIVMGLVVALCGLAVGTAALDNWARYFAPLPSMLGM